MQPVRQRQGVVFQKMILDGVMNRGMQDMPRWSALDTKLGTVCMALLQREPRWPTWRQRQDEATSRKMDFMVLGNGWPGSKCMDLLTDGQYGPYVGAHLLCYSTHARV